MITAARPTSSQAAHYYFPDGKPCYSVKCTTKEGERPTNVSDAKKLGLLPSPTTILRVLHKEGLVQWKIEQCLLACLTAPKRDDEAIDAFVERIIHTDREHEQEAKAAADMGTRIHAALQAELGGQMADHEMLPYIEPVWEFLNNRRCDAFESEAVLVGDGYAGRTDFLETFVRSFGHEDYLWDFKTKDKLPKKAYLEDRLQLAAYAAATKKPHVRTGNIYISRTEPGKFSVCIHDDWRRDYEAFRHLLEYWRIVNDFS